MRNRGISLLAAMAVAASGGFWLAGCDEGTTSPDDREPEPREPTQVPPTDPVPEPQAPAEPSQPATESPEY